MKTALPLFSAYFCRSTAIIVNSISVGVSSTVVEIIYAVIMFIVCGTFGKLKNILGIYTTVYIYMIIYVISCN